MSDDYNRRNRHSSSNDDFDWDAFDRKTSSGYGESAPLRRRRRSGDSDVIKRRARAIDDNRARSRQQRPESKPKKKKQKKQLTEKQLAARRGVRTFLIVLIAAIVVVCAGMFVGMYTAVSREIKDMNIDGLALNNTSVIYYIDSAGVEREYEKLQSDTNRIWVSSENIAPGFKDAIVSIEDERFYSHKGVDIKRTFGATVKYVLSKVGFGESTYGGSTITQQVIKNITSENDFKATRKIKEMMRALALERELSKDDILTMYCNIVYFANNCNGVEAAAQLYFGKPASDLNIQEAASIAGITQYPAEFDPIAHPDKNVSKRNTVLAKMYELGKITEQEYQAAIASPLELSTSSMQRQNRVTSYFTDQVVNDLIRDLMREKSYSEDFAARQVYNGGFKIYATVDPHVQSVMESVYEDRSNFPGGADIQSAMVITDPYTGAVKGLIGGLGEKTDVRGWNRATQAKRQPGSSIKPLSVYGPAIDLGKVTEVDVIKDEEITIGNDNWKPKNSYAGFKGDMSVKEAISRSANIPAVKILDMVGLSNSYGYLTNKFHITTITDGDKNFSSLALGGLTQGVTVEEMAAAYGVFVNRGKYITPYTYSKVVDQSNTTILENFVNASQAMSESAAYITSDLLSGPVNLPYGTATSARLSTGMPTYGKTGTTDDDFDKWFVGFTPYYVGAVWFGFDTPSSLSKAGISGNPCITAWKLVFEKLSSEQVYKAIEKPASVIQTAVCSISGKLPGGSCQKVTAYFVDGTQPKQTCVSHASLPKATGETSISTVAPKPAATQKADAAATSAPAAGGTDKGSAAGGTAGSAAGGTSGAAAGQSSGAAAGQTSGGTAGQSSGAAAGQSSGGAVGQSSGAAAGAAVSGGASGETSHQAETQQSSSSGDDFMIPE
ncbi:MAG: PBP1A family penicillin-binding protein [Clostridia bacterium]|nr:PBP1A family penicillin-binding protein [Clostridia bacterium]